MKVLVNVVLNLVENNEYTTKFPEQPNKTRKLVILPQIFNRFLCFSVKLIFLASTENRQSNKIADGVWLAMKTMTAIINRIVIFI